MKKMFITLVALLSCRLAVAAESYSSHSTFGLSVHPISTIFGAPGFSVDTKIQDAITMGLTSSFTSKNDLILDSETVKNTVKAKAYSFELKPTYYFSGQAFSNSWTLSGLFGYHQSKFKHRYLDDKKSLSAMSMGTMFGYHTQTKSGVSFDAGLGVRYLIGGEKNIRLSNVQLERKSDQLTPVGHLAVGYVF